MTTRKILITNKYLRLCKIIDNKLDKLNILPNIDAYDFMDLVFMFNIYFLDCDKHNYRDKIRDLINIGNIILTEFEMSEIYDLFYDFILWYKQLQ